MRSLLNCSAGPQRSGDLTFAALMRNMPSIITRCERIFRSGRMRPAHARSSGSETLLRIRSLAGYIIGTLESRIRKRHALNKNFFIVMPLSTNPHHSPMPVRPTNIMHVTATTAITPITVRMSGMCGTLLSECVTRPIEKGDCQSCPE